jgi:hypothetical protein
MTIQSPNTKIAGGTIKGDVYIEAQGFNLSQEAKIEGNIFSMQMKMSRLQRLLKGILQVRKKYNHNK